MWLALFFENDEKEEKGKILFFSSSFFCQLLQLSLFITSVISSISIQQTLNCKILNGVAIYKQRAIISNYFSSLWIFIRIPCKDKSMEEHRK